MDSEGIVGEAGRFWVLGEEQTPTPTTPSNCRLHMAHEMMRGMGWSIEPVRCIDVGQVPFFLFLFFFWRKRLKGCSFCESLTPEKNRVTFF